MKDLFLRIGEFFSSISFFQNQYFVFLLVVLIGIIVAKVIEKIIASRNIKAIKSQPIRNLISKIFHRNFIYIGILIVILISLDYMAFEENTLKVIKSVISTLIAILTYYMTKKITKSLFDIFTSPRYFKKARFFKNKNLMNLLNKFFAISLFIIIATIILGSWGIKVGPILTGLGIAGLAVGLAIQDSLSNIFGGISLILDNAYQEDDFIELENGIKGIIYSIGYRSTKLKTFNDEIILIPNGKIAQMEVKNLSRPSEIYRLSLDVGVAYGSDIQHVKDVILDVLNAEVDVLDFPEPVVFFLKMSDFSLKFKIYANIRSPYIIYFMTDKIYEGIYKAFIEEGIKIPFPTTTVHLHNDPGGNEL